MAIRSVAFLEICMQQVLHAVEKLNGQALADYFKVSQRTTTFVEPMTNNVISNDCLNDKNKHTM